jgi:hypothetical protein
MTNLLNLDDLVITRKVVLKGKERALNSMTVEQFIASDNIEDRLKKAKGGAQIKLLVEQIAVFMEDTTEAELMKLQVPQLFALLAFIRGTDAEKAPAPGNEPAPKSE